jgi:hypothetical protein
MGTGSNAILEMDNARDEGIRIKPILVIYIKKQTKCGINSDSASGWKKATSRFVAPLSLIS